MNEQENPIDLAMVYANLGTAYRERIRNDRADNIEQAITYYHQALEMWSWKKNQIEWAMTQADLATAYRERIRDDRADNIERAIKYYQRSLEKLSRKKNPIEWAMTQVNLATAYRERIHGDRADNIEQAITYYHQALEKLSRKENPIEWAMTQTHLTTAYRERVKGESANNIESAVAHEQLVLEVFTDLWNISRVKNISYQVHQFCQLFSKLTTLPLLSYHSLIAEGVYLAIFDLSSVFQDHLLQVVNNEFPILFLTTDNLEDEHLEHIRQSLSEKLGPSNRRALLIPLGDEKSYPTVKDIFASSIKKVYAYDIICLSRNTVTQIIASLTPPIKLRETIVSEMDLTRIVVYKPTGPVPDNMFFGREQEIQEICDNVAATNYVLIGGRRIGKTSILQHLLRVRLPATGFYPLYYDCSYVHTEAELLQALVTDPIWFPKSPVPPPSTLGEVLRALPYKLNIVILLDEVDNLIKSEQQSDYPIFNVLRAFSNDNRCRFVLCGERKLQSELTNSNSPFFNFATEMLIGRLERHSVKELVTQPMKQLGVVFDDQEAIVQRIWEFTSGQPSLVQSLCLQLLLHINQPGNRRIILQDVETIVTDLNFLRNEFLKIYWARATILERLCTLIMAVHEDARKLMSIHKALISWDIKVTLNQLDKALERLVILRNILQETSTGYEFAVTAFPEVIAKAGRVDDLIALDREFYQQHGDVDPSSKGDRR